jgi:acyl-CoA thioester hydrolase
VVRRIEADFVGMARLGDLLEVRTKLLEEKQSNILLEQQIFRADEMVFAMQVRLVYVVAGSPRRIPAQLLEIIESIRS